MAYLFRKNRARERAQNTLREIAKQGRVLPPTLGTVPCEYISLPALDIPKLAAAYAQAMESQETNDWCRCEWIIHPDDVSVKANHCRECKQSKGDIRHDETSQWYSHTFRGKRMRRGDSTADDCPIHTKEGMIIYFFEWVFTRDKN